VPELVGRITTQEVANLALDYLEHPEKLAEIGINLSLVRGEPGAALKIADIVQELFAIPGSQTNNF
jgi:hypothetical protein